MTERPTALLLAGGFATRLWPLTEQRAKPLLPLSGKPLIQHIIDRIPEDIEIIISTNQVFEEGFQELADQFPDRTIRVFREDSAHDRSKVGALAATALVIDEFSLNTPLLLIAGDNYFGFDLEHFMNAYEGRTLLASYDTQSLEAARQFGVVKTDGKRLEAFVEKPQDPPSTLVSTGCYLFQPEHLPEITEYSQTAADNLGGIFEHLLRKEADIDVYSFSEDWIDIGSFQSYLDAHKKLLPENRTHNDAQVRNSEFGDHVEIGAHCQIEDSELEEVLIMAGSVIKNCRLRACVIDENCHLENVDLSHKMIRAGSRIIGNERSL